MRRKTKLAIILSVLILMILVIAGWMIFNQHNTKEIDKGYIMASFVREGDDIWEVRVDLNDRQKYLYKNGVKLRSLRVLNFISSQPCIELPDVQNGHEGINIENEEQTQVLTWKSDLYKSALYIKYLKESGYNEIRYASTPGYVEIYLQNGDVIKRVLITNNELMQANVLNNNLPDIKNYLK